MTIEITDRDLLILSLSTIRCLVANSLLDKEDIMADLARQGIDHETAFKIKAVLDNIPNK